MAHHPGDDTRTPTQAPAERPRLPRPRRRHDRGHGPDIDASPAHTAEDGFRSSDPSGRLQVTARLPERLSRSVWLVIAAFLLVVSPVAAQADWSGFRDIGGVFAAGAPITAISRNAKRIDLFVTGLNGHVYTSSYSAGGDWTGIGSKWEDIGGVFSSGAPLAAVSRNPKQIDLFVTGLNGHVYTSFSANGGGWSGVGDKWLDIGGVFPVAAPLAVLSRNPNQMDVFVTGNDGHVYTSWYIDGSDWSGLGDKWLDIGGVFPVGAPLAAVSRHPNQMDVFVTGNDGHVYNSFFLDGGAWSGVGDKWRDIGGVFQPAAPVAAISRNPSQIDLFITGQQGDVYTSWYIDGSDWSGLGDNWLDIGGVFPSAAPVSAVTRDPHRMDLFITGNDGVVYTSWFNDGGDWSGLGNQWRTVGGTFPAGAPLAALSRTPDRLDVFVTGNDGIVYTSTSADGGAKPANPTPTPAPGGAKPTPTAPPAAVQVTVVQSVDVYDAPGGDGQQIGTLRKGTKGVSLVEPCKDDWCHVTWANGKGWVYDGPDYDSLKY